MTEEVKNLYIWIMICTVIAALCTTAFPVMYAFRPWRSTLLGKILMLQGVAFALAMDGTVLFQFWTSVDIYFAVALQAIVFTMIAIATSSLTVMMWQANRTKGDKMAKHEAETPSKPFLSDSAYNVLKFLALIALPAVGALYFGLASIWGLPKAEEVVGTVTVIDTFLGVLLRISTKSYNASDVKYDGVMEVSHPNSDGVQTFQLQLDNHPTELVDKDQVSFKVQVLPEEVSTTPGDLPMVHPATS